MRHSLRTRIFAVCLAVATGVSLLFGVLSVLLWEHLEFEQSDRVLRAESSLFMQHHREQAGTPPPNSYLVRGWVVAADRSEDLPEALRDLPPGHHQVGTGQDELAVMVTEADSWRYVFTMNLPVMNVWEPRVFGIVILLVAVCSLAGALAGRMLSRRVAEPVTRLAERVSSPAARNGSLHFADGQRDDEVGALAHAMDDHVAQLQDYARREHDFTAQVSHELRTPLAVASSAVELLLVDAKLDDEARRRLLGTERSLGHMTETVEALLMLARSEAGTGAEVDINVADLLGEALAQCRPLLGDRPVDLRLQVDSRPVVRALPGALRIVVRNLLANACAHTARGEILARLQSGSLSVRDTGSGISEHDLPHVREAGFRGSATRGDGDGLGLAIVQRLCTRYGWQLSIDSATDKGTTATLHFAA